MRNILPALSWTATIPGQLFMGYLADKLGSRFWVLFPPQILQSIPGFILTIWPPGNKVKVGAFFIKPLFFSTPIFMTWVSEICHGSAEERGVVLGLTQTIFFAFNNWLPNVVFQQTEALRFPKGFRTNLACLFAALVCMAFIHFMYKRQQRREVAEYEVQDEEGSQVAVRRRSSFGFGQGGSLLPFVPQVVGQVA